MKILLFIVNKKKIILLIGFSNTVKKCRKYQAIIMNYELLMG